MGVQQVGPYTVAVVSLQPSFHAVDLAVLFLPALLFIFPSIVQLRHQAAMVMAAYQYVGGRWCGGGGCQLAAFGYQQPILIQWERALSNLQTLQEAYGKGINCLPRPCVSLNLCKKYMYKMSDSSLHKAMQTHSARTSWLIGRHKQSLLNCPCNKARVIIFYSWISLQHVPDHCKITSSSSRSPHWFLMKGRRDILNWLIYHTKMNRFRLYIRSRIPSAMSTTTLLPDTAPQEAWSRAKAFSVNILRKKSCKTVHYSLIGCYLIFQFYPSRDFSLSLQSFPLSFILLRISGRISFPLLYPEGKEIFEAFQRISFTRLPWAQCCKKYLVLVCVR